MRLLVVEDEPEGAAVLARGLREHAFAVDVAVDGRDALDQLGINDYDLNPSGNARTTSYPKAADGAHRG